MAWTGMRDLPPVSQRSAPNLTNNHYKWLPRRQAAVLGLRVTRHL
jgi:hypothetical protein